MINMLFRVQLTKKREIALGKLLEKFMLYALCVGEKLFS
jgi:hypothetical protein